jgi:steroid 5-alpha reductase family enzyme
MTPVLAAATGFACVALFLTIVWAIQLRTRNAGMVDPVWSWSLGFLAVWYAIFGDAPVETRLVLGLLGGIWGFRLGTHLYFRNAGKPEDARYAKFRNEWGTQANRNMFWFFIFQAVMAFLLSVGFLTVAYRSGAPSLPLVILAVVIWIIAVAGEGIADRQMEKFRADPATKGKVCNAGLWRYSRHPNYFFESLHWIAYVPLAIGTGYWWVALIPAAIMAWLLLKMSGVPILEAHLVKSRPGYAEYMRTTSVFIPWPPKSSGQ